MDKDLLLQLRRLRRFLENKKKNIEKELEELEPEDGVFVSKRIERIIKKIKNFINKVL